MNYAEKINNLLDVLGVGTAEDPEGLLAYDDEGSVFVTDGHNSGQYAAGQLEALLKGLLDEGKIVSFETIWWEIESAEIL